MARLKPVTPGESLQEEFLKPMGITPYRLAKEVHVPARRIGEIVAGRRAISADTDLRLCRFFGLSNGYWLRAQVAHDTEVAPTALGRWRDFGVHREGSMAVDTEQDAIRKILAESRLYRWTRSELLFRRIGLGVLLLALAVGPLFVRWNLPVVAMIVLGVAAFSWSVISMIHTLLFEQAVAEDNLVPPAEKSQLRIKSLVSPLARERLASRLRELAKERLRT